MKIQESSLQLQASHDAKRTHKVEETMQREFRRVFSDLKAAEGENAEAAKKRVQKMLQSLIDAIIAAVDGKKCTKSANLPEAAETSGTASGSGELPRLPGVGGEIDWRSTRIEYLYESETSQVCGQGRVVCSDGRSLEFEFSFSRAREFEKTSLEHSEGTIKLRDPLILSFPGCASELSEERIDFDLDADGRAERIPGLNRGCGFLVFDRNGNGKADNGKELFGVASGDGFADLAQLDRDGNGWVDEGDPDFSRLRLWTVDGSKTLAEAGIGALATARVSAPFSLKTADNALLGEIRAAGIYLSETGEAGRMAQVDLAVEETSATLPATGENKPGERQQLTA